MLFSESLPAQIAMSSYFPQCDCETTELQHSPTGLTVDGSQDDRDDRLFAEVGDTPGKIWLTIGPSSIGY